MLENRDADCEIVSLEAAKAGFLASEVGSQYGYNGWMQKHWWQEVGARFGPGQHYLDYTGAGQFTTSQLADAFKELSTIPYGNPHSKNPSSARATQEVAAARAQVQAHFNASPDDYYVIFTKGATEGLKMVGEYFPWSKPTGNPCHRCRGSQNTAAVPKSHFMYTQANHKSVLGIGAYAKHAGAQLHCITKDQMDAWLCNPDVHVPVPEGPSQQGNCCTSSSSSNSSSSSTPGSIPRLTSASSLDSTSSEPPQPHTPPVGSYSSDISDEQLLLATEHVKGSGGQPDAAAAATSACQADTGSDGLTFHLVAYPAKDNYEGRLYPLDWVKQVHSKSNTSSQYFVLLDCAAYAATHQLDLSATQPDFVTMSFYKLFGYPSGLGALLVRKEAARKLNKVYFGGGSVDYCTAEDAWHVLSEAPAGYEDGTLGFLNIASLKHGFNQLAQLGGMKAITAHVESLRVWTFNQLQQLTHTNGEPLVRVFGHHEEGPEHQGGIFQFQVLTPEGDRVPGSLVEAAATAAGLHLRTGCNCNPGRCLPNLDIWPEEERERAATFHRGPFLVVMRPQGAPKQKQEVPPSPGSTTAVREAAVTFFEGGDLQGGHEAPLVPVPLPLGSVRVSLGAYSTFEDCYALVRLLCGTFKDFEVYQRDVAAGEKVVTVVDDAEHVVRLKARIAFAK